MKKGFCCVSVAAVRSAPDHRSEMTTQLLYGETFEVLSAEQKFLYIRMDFDGYEGWLHYRQADLESGISSGRTLVTEPFLLTEIAGKKMLLSQGSEQPGSEPFAPLPATEITDTAKQWLNVPYLWSGRSFFGVDCSGFVQMVYKLHGIALPREAAAQAAVGEVLSFVEESQPGDLAFFDNEEGTIVHVGIMLSPHQIIHAFGAVRIDEIDSSGIFNKELNTHTHRLRMVRSLF